MEQKPLALISVSDKSNLIPFAKELVATHNYRLLSTGGTARALAEAGLPVVEVADHTGFPEMMNGRIKTLHPKIHGGLLCRRDKAEHLESAAVHGIDLIDLVVINLYPFEETIARPGAPFAEAIENIDIGGPAMLRSAAKNYAAVTVVCDPKDYQAVLDGLGKPEKLPGLRRRLAADVFERTSRYDAAITTYLRRAGEEPTLDTIAGFPENLELTAPREMKLRYGENPHQQAALYGRFLECFEQLHGKELSFNNVVDISAAAYLIGEFEKPTVAILKHTNPCGVASADGLIPAWEMAFETDKQAPFGGIIIVNQQINEDFAAKVREDLAFAEVVIAPSFSPKALDILKKKKNLRLMIAREGLGPESLQEVKTVIGGYLVQDRDQKRVNPMGCRVVTEREPSADEWASLIFGWRVCKHVKSNAIVYAKGERTLGIGAGQMSRVDSSQIAVWKAANAGLSLDGSIIASEALFPFPDGLAAAADAGATAAIQPGGAIRDEDIIKLANERGMAMVFTGVRHFKH